VNAAARRPRSHHYSVYVVELADRVWNVASFRRANPDYRLGQPFVYVGMTGLDPDLRFDRHMAGVQANRFVLVDKSTNGTFVTFEGEQELGLRRDEITLRKNGWISFGQPRSAAGEDVMEFACD